FFPFLRLGQLVGGGLLGGFRGFGIGLGGGVGLFLLGFGLLDLGLGFLQVLDHLLVLLGRLVGRFGARGVLQFLGAFGQVAQHFFLLSHGRLLLGFKQIGAGFQRCLLGRFDQRLRLRETLQSIGQLAELLVHVGLLLDESLGRLFVQLGLLGL